MKGHQLEHVLAFKSVIRARSLPSLEQYAYTTSVCHPDLSTYMFQNTIAYSQKRPGLLTPMLMDTLAYCDLQYMQFINLPICKTRICFHKSLAYVRIRQFRINYYSIYKRTLKRPPRVSLYTMSHHPANSVVGLLSDSISALANPSFSLVVPIPAPCCCSADIIASSSARCFSVASAKCTITSSPNLPLISSRERPLVCLQY